MSQQPPPPKPPQDPPPVTPLPPGNGNTPPPPVTLPVVFQPDYSFNPITTAERDAATSVSQGVVIYNSDDNELQSYVGDEWKSLTLPAALALPLLAQAMAPYLPSDGDDD